MQNDQIKLEKIEVQNQNRIKAGDIFNINTGKKDVNETVENGQYAFFSCSPHEYRSNEYLLDGEAILIAGNGSYAGNVRAYKGKFDLYQRTYALLLKENKKNNWDINFLYFHFKWYFERKYMGGTHGGAIPYIVRGDIDGFEIPVLLKTEQTQIAEILSSLDDKIELNRKMNETLEKIGQALFKHWFVDFEFPDENGKPYKSNGGKMVDIDLPYLVNIPEHWGGTDNVSVFDDKQGFVGFKKVFKYEKGFEPGAQSYSTENFNLNEHIRFYRVSDLENGKIPDIFIDKDKNQDLTCEEDDVLVSLDGTVGKIAIGCKGSYSSGVYKIYSPQNNIFGDIHNSFIYFYFKSNYVQNILKDYSKGATIMHAATALCHLYAPIQQHYIKLFQQISDGLYDLILKNLKEIQILSQIRDSLLPRLMSGKLRVK